MPLTPEDVRNKRFTPVRLREGYDMGEVDQFLDEVESELDRLAKENDDLRSKLSASGSGSREQVQDVGVPTSEAAEPSDEGEAATVSGPSDTSQPGVEAAPVRTIAQASGAAARLLELATRNADEVMAEAKDEADRILAEARSKAERLQTESRSKADRMEDGARARAEKLDSDTAERRQQLFADLEKDRDRLSSEVEQLRSFEREYRSRLKAYFTEQLVQLEGEQGAAVSGPGSEADQADHAPTRLRSLLADDASQNSDQQGQQK